MNIEEAKTLLNQQLSIDESSFMAIYGDNDIDKKEIVKEICDGYVVFYHKALLNANKKKQLSWFVESIKKQGVEIENNPTDWLEAFSYIRDFVKQSKDKRKIILIDEISLMDSKKSDLLMGLESFWNGFAYLRKDVVLIICSSDVAWMESKIIYNIGGLYHRLNQQIYLETN